MRFTKLITGAALCGFAALAAAQDTPPAEPEQKQSSLSDLEATVNQLTDEQREQEATDAATQPATGTRVRAPQPQAPQPAAEAAQPPAESPRAAPVPAPTITPPAANAPTRFIPPLTAAQQAEIDRIIERGRLLIAIAGAGQVATQDMLSRVPNPVEAGVDGWIAEPEGNGVTVTFYHEQEGGPTTVYRANVLASRVVSRDVFLGTYRPPLSRPQARLVAARDATERLDSRPCTSQPFNVFIVPPARAGAPIEIYRMSAPSERGRFPLGGHFKAVVNADGAIASQRTFVEGCPMLELGEAPAAGQQPRPIPVAGGADTLPNEMQVLLSRMTGRPLLVTTGDPPRQWLIAGERIAEVRNGAIVQPPAPGAIPAANRPQGR
jgi:hypothetical protein